MTGRWTQLGPDLLNLRNGDYWKSHRRERSDQREEPAWLKNNLKLRKIFSCAILRQQTGQRVHETGRQRKQQTSKVIPEQQTFYDQFDHLGFRAVPKCRIASYVLEEPVEGHQRRGAVGE